MPVTAGRSCKHRPITQRGLCNEIAIAIYIVLALSCGLVDSDEANLEGAVRVSAGSFPFRSTPDSILFPSAISTLSLLCI